MCWIKEFEYGNKMCFDYIWNPWHPEDFGVVPGLEVAGVEIIDENKCRNEFFDLLTSWHDRGLIKPKNGR